MSFSSKVKNELCKLDTGKQCCMLAELAAVIRISGGIKITGNNQTSIKISTENAAFARRIFTIIRKVFNICPEVIIRRSKKLKKHITYILVVTALQGSGELLNAAGISLKQYRDKEYVSYEFDLEGFLSSSCCEKAYLRGAFLSGGSVSDPEKTYHLEITSHNYDLALEINRFMESYGLKPKIIKRKGSLVSYLKEGENIVDFLNIIGAHSALLEFENVRILKEMRNNVNRIVNCETANLDKTINASVRQVDNIRYIKKHIGFDVLPKNLREVAELRLVFSDASLKELGQMLTPRLGKSGVNHRLRRLDRIAEHERAIRGEL
ncbi:MAG: DNA-binding protein WhiA [Acetivibrionales bacterium]